MKLRLSVVLVIATLIAAFLLFTQHSLQPSDPFVSLSSCLRGSDPVSQTCLRAQLGELLASTTTEALMHYIVASTSPAGVRGQCHAISHEIGQETFLREHSLERALNACTQECNSGCVHGAIAAEVAATFGEKYLGEEIEHADTAQLASLGKKYCSGSRALCHGIGHIARIATSSLSGALSICDGAAATEVRASCYLGVYMEDNGRVAFVQHEAPDIGEDYGFPCSALASRYLPTCYEKLVDYRTIQFNATHVPVANRLRIMSGVCTALSQPARGYCFFGYGYGLNRLIGSEVAAYPYAPQCDALNTDDANACMRGLSYFYATFARYEDALSYCDSRGSAENKKSCYDIGFAHMGLPLEDIARTCDQFHSSTCATALASFRARGLTPVFDEGNI